MRQQDDGADAGFFQLRHLRGRDFGRIEEFKSFRVDGAGLHLGFRCGKPEHADFDTADFKNPVRFKNGFRGPFFHDVRREQREIRFCDHHLQIIESVVEVVVADAHGRDAHVVKQPDHALAV